MPKYVIKKENRCPSCQAPKIYTTIYPEEKIETGKGKIKKYETGRIIKEWKCSRCGNTGYDYES